ncbi:MAG: hypothetical protein VKM17_09295, partial [Cyanobacteriota bacterium]|nr:hypothetical protein [Cyanobacteriota bacterium]
MNNSWRIDNQFALENTIIKKILNCKNEDELQRLASEEISTFLDNQLEPANNQRIVNLFHKQFELLRYDEFKDKATTDWKRIRSAIEHENTLVNHRLTWLLTSQAFLFAGFGLVFTSMKNSSFDIIYSLLLLSLISLVGIAVSCKICLDIEGASRQLAELDHWWHTTYAPSVFKSPQQQSGRELRRAASLKLKHHHPNIQGWGGVRKNFWAEKGLKVEIIFITAWLMIVAGVVARPLAKRLGEIKTFFSDADGWLIIPIFFAIILLMAWR